MSSESLIMSLEDGKHVELVSPEGKTYTYPWLDRLIGRYNGTVHTISGGESVWYLKIGITEDRSSLLYRLIVTTKDHVSTRITLQFTAVDDNTVIFTSIPHDKSIVSWATPLHPPNHLGLLDIVHTTPAVLLSSYRVDSDANHIKHTVLLSFGSDGTMSVQSATYDQETGSLNGSEIGRLNPCDPSKPIIFHVVESQGTSTIIEEL